MKKAVFLLVVFGGLNISFAQIASNLSKNEKYAFTHRLEELTLNADRENSESELTELASNFSVSAVQSALKKMYAKKPSKEGLLNLVYNDPTFGRFINDEEDVWRHLGISKHDLKRLQLYLK